MSSFNQYPNQPIYPPVMPQPNYPPEMPQPPPEMPSSNQHHQPNCEGDRLSFSQHQNQPEMSTRDQHHNQPSHHQPEMPSFNQHQNQPNHQPEMLSSNQHHQPNCERDGSSFNQHQNQPNFERENPSKYQPEMSTRDQHQNQPSHHQPEMPSFNQHQNQPNYQPQMLNYNQHHQPNWERDGSSFNQHQNQPNFERERSNFNQHQNQPNYEREKPSYNQHQNQPNFRCDAQTFVYSEKATGKEVVHSSGSSQSSETTQRSQSTQTSLISQVSKSEEYEAFAAIGFAALQTFLAFCFVIFIYKSKQHTLFPVVILAICGNAFGVFAHISSHRVLQRVYILILLVLIVGYLAMTVIVLDKKHFKKANERLRKKHKNLNAGLFIFGMVANAIAAIVLERYYAKCKTNEMKREVVQNSQPQPNV